MLIQAQREWIRFRDNDCEFQTYATAMGSIHPMMMAICL
nr:lysozyme inhibitor LprI family protein [Rosenbergiella epipactidis]